jgi:hypothetical protein
MRSVVGLDPIFPHAGVDGTAQWLAAMSSCQRSSLSVTYTVPTEIDAVQLAELLGTLIDLVASADTDTQLSTSLCQSPVCFRFWLGLSSGQAALHCNEAASGLLEVGGRRGLSLGAAIEFVAGSLEQTWRVYIQAV